MSHSGPFFNNRPIRYRKDDLVSEAEYKRLHWTKQLVLRPLRDKRKWVNPEADYDNRIDNWDITNDKETT